MRNNEHKNPDINIYREYWLSIWVGVLTRFVIKLKGLVK
jgi:hypothetical protein